MSQESNKVTEPTQGTEDSNFAGTLLDCIAKGVIAIAPSRQIIAFNDAANRLIGLPAKDVLNRSMAVLPPPLQAIIDETLVTGQPVLRRRIVLSRAGGADD